jgi:hypothetical protein
VTSPRTSVDECKGSARRALLCRYHQSPHRSGVQGLTRSPKHPAGPTMTLGNMRELGARDENGLPLALSEPPRLSQNDQSWPMLRLVFPGKTACGPSWVHAFQSPSTAFTATHANTSAYAAYAA